MSLMSCLLISTSDCLCHYPNLKMLVFLKYAKKSTRAQLIVVGWILVFALQTQTNNKQTHLYNKYLSVPKAWRWKYYLMWPTCINSRTRILPIYKYSCPLVYSTLIWLTQEGRTKHHNMLVSMTTTHISLLPPPGISHGLETKLRREKIYWFTSNPS